MNLKQRSILAVLLATTLSTQGCFLQKRDESESGGSGESLSNSDLTGTFDTVCRTTTLSGLGTVYFYDTIAINLNGDGLVRYYRRYYDGVGFNSKCYTTNNLFSIIQGGSYELGADSGDATKITFTMSEFVEIDPGNSAGLTYLNNDCSVGGVGAPFPDGDSLPSSTMVCGFSEQPGLSEDLFNLVRMSGTTLYMGITSPLISGPGYFTTGDTPTSASLAFPKR
ncbi:MAG TPA: hypothetical protein VM901_03170 [Bdellovibrionota bacterium]|jgi:hypothetical protein|nr:hypothetical protein [Bdellovibrionota bacterium]